MKDKTVTYNGQEMSVYDARQKQRGYERTIKKTKAELVAYDEALKRLPLEEQTALKFQFQNASVKLKGQEAKLADFCRQTGLKRDKFREQMFAAETEDAIKAWSKSASSKAVWANRKALTTKTENDIIKEIKNCGIKGNITLGTDNVDLSIFSFDDKHINKERKHNVTFKDAERFVKEAKFIATRWKGRFKNYYGESGAVFVDIENKNIRTAFKSGEFTEEVLKALEVLKKYGR